MILLQDFIVRLIEQYRIHNKEFLSDTLDVEMKVVWKNNQVQVVEPKDKVNELNIHKIILKGVLI